MRWEKSKLKLMFQSPHVCYSAALPKDQVVRKHPPNGGNRPAVISLVWRGCKTLFWIRMKTLSWPWWTLSGISLIWIIVNMSRERPWCFNICTGYLQGRLRAISSRVCFVKKLRRREEKAGHFQLFLWWPKQLSSPNSNQVFSVLKYNKAIDTVSEM